MVCARREPGASIEFGASSAPLKTSPCRVGQTRAAAICGTLTVFENRAARTGRTIGIHFVVIEAKHRTHRAIAFNPGGPGVSSTSLAADFADSTTGAFATLRDDYDFLLVDNRGTGDSAPQNCNFAPAEHQELYFRQLWPDTIVRSCRERLSARADLSLYSTSEASDDLDDVRAALGYPKLVLFGGSYGTRFYLDYARRHPDSVESVVLEGVAPPHFYIIPLPMARGAQTAIDGLEEACRHDADLFGAFSPLREHFAAVAQRFDSGSVTISVQNPVTKSLAERATYERGLCGDDPARAVLPITSARTFRSRSSGRIVASTRRLPRWSVRWRSSSRTFRPTGSTFRSRAPRTFRSLRKRTLRDTAPARSRATFACGRSSVPVSSGTSILRRRLSSNRYAATRRSS